MMYNAVSVDSHFFHTGGVMLFDPAFYMHNLNFTVVFVSKQNSKLKFFIAFWRADLFCIATRIVRRLG